MAELRHTSDEAQARHKLGGALPQHRLAEGQVRHRQPDVGNGGGDGNLCKLLKKLKKRSSAIKMIKEKFSYYLLCKSFVTILTLFLFICSPRLESFDGLAKVGYFLPLNQEFREIYTSYGLALGIEASYPIYPWDLPFEIFAQIDDTHASGKIDMTPRVATTAVRTVFRLLQLEAGLKYYINIKGFSFYVGAAPSINYIHVKNEWQLPARSINLRNMGYILKLGSAFFVRDLLIDFSVDYVDVPANLNLAQEPRFNFLSQFNALRFYLGLGFRY